MSVRVGDRRMPLQSMRVGDGRTHEGVHGRDTWEIYLEERGPFPWCDTKSPDRFLDKLGRLLRTYNPPRSESEIGSRGERQPLPTSAFLPFGSNIQLCKR